MIFEIVCQKRSIWKTQIKMLWTLGEGVRLNSKKDHYFKNKTETHREIQLQGNTDFTTSVITKEQRQWDKITECLVVLQLRDQRQHCLGQLKTDCCIVLLIVVSLGFSRPFCGPPIQLSLATFSLLPRATFTISGMEVPHKHTENR